MCTLKAPHFLYRQGLNDLLSISFFLFLNTKRPSDKLFKLYPFWLKWLEGWAQPLLFLPGAPPLASFFQIEVFSSGDIHGMEFLDYEVNILLESNRDRTSRTWEIARQTLPLKCPPQSRNTYFLLPDKEQHPGLNSTASQKQIKFGW